MQVEGAGAGARQDSDADGPSTTVEGRVRLRADRTVAGRWAAFAGGGVELRRTDVDERRLVTEAGASATWWSLEEDDEAGVALATDLGARFERQRRGPRGGGGGGTATRDVLAPRLGVTFAGRLPRTLRVASRCEVVVELDGDARTRLHSETRLSSALGGGLALSLAYRVAYDSGPPDGDPSTDTRLTTSLEVAF